MDLVTATLVGVAVGIITGLLPGLHVNTIAAVAFAVVPAAGPIGAVFLLAVGTVHTIVNILPATYLGAPDEDDVLAVLPAHRLLLAGRGAEAVAVSVAASLTGVILAFGLGWGLHRLFAGPAAWWIDAATPWVLVLVVLVLWMQEARHGPWGPLKAATVSLLAGGLGWTSANVPLAPWVAVPPSTLLPLLGGLFGAAGLTVAFQQPTRVPWQPDPQRMVRRPVPAALGSVLAGATALMPGLTAAVATAMVPGIRGRPLHAVAAMSAINTAHAVLAIVVWLSTGRIRTGLADALQQWSPMRWVGVGPTPSAAWPLAVILAAAVLGAGATIVLDHALRRHVDRLPSRALAAFGLAFLTVLVAVLSGWTGLLVYGIAIAVGRMPLRLGVRRVHLVACLIVPALIWTTT